MASAVATLGRHVACLAPKTAAAGRLASSVAARRLSTAAAGHGAAPVVERREADGSGRGGIREGRGPITSNQAAILPELPGMPVLKPASALEAPETRVTTLSNGLRVATEETYGQVANVTLFVDSGSRLERPEESGVSHFLETLSFKTTGSRTSEDITSDSSELSLLAGAGQDSTVYRVEALRGELERGVAVLGDSVTDPLYTDAEMEEGRRTIEFQLMGMEENYDSALQVGLLQAAYGPTAPLGRPLVCPPEQIETMTADHLRAFRARTHIAPRMVLAGAGVAHDRLVEMAEKYFSGIPAEGSEPVVDEPDVYVGGERRTVITPQYPTPDSDMVHMAVCFPCAGWADEDIVPLCVLDSLLGGGTSFSAGGPGKGMYTRLYLEVLNKYPWAEAASAFALHANNAGLSGIYGSAHYTHARDIASVIVGHLRLPAQLRVTPQELSRARNQLRGAVMLQLERRGVLCEDIGRQILQKGEREDPATLCDKIEAVSVDDIMRVASRVFENKPSVAVVGPNLSAVPAYGEIEEFFAA